MLVDLARALRRRWYVVVVGLLATAGLAYGAFAITPPSYTARGLVLLMPSEQSVGPGGNPFLVLADLELPARLLVAYFESATARADVEADAPDAEYTVSIEESTRGPVIAVDVRDSTAASTLSTLESLTDDIPRQLERLQVEAEVPDDAVVSSIPLAVDDEAEIDTGDTVRSVIAASVVGLVLTALIAYAVDGRLARRAERRARRRAEAAAPETTASEDVRPWTPDEQLGPAPLSTTGDGDADRRADDGSEPAARPVPARAGRER